MTRILACFSMAYTLCMGGCKESILELPPYPEDKKWEEITAFNDADIRYMITHDDMLFISAVIGHDGVDDTSGIFMTKDGMQWDTLQLFERQIGPMVFNEDTLTVLETGRIWEYHQTFGWRIKYKTLIDARITYDMFYLYDELYVFQIGDDYVFSNKNIRKIERTPVESRFIKHQLHGKEVAYTMPYYTFVGFPHRFDGSNFYPLDGGISTSENIIPNYPALCIHDDTLYAGFNSPARIKKLVNDVWINATDTLTNISTIKNHVSFISNTPASIIFCRDKMVIGTESMGILLQTGQGWISISRGLKKQYSNLLKTDIYSPIIFLAYLNGTIYTGYGEPGFAPVFKGRGLFKYQL